MAHPGGLSPRAPYRARIRRGSAADGAGRVRQLAPRGRPCESVRSRASSPPIAASIGHTLSGSRCAPALSGRRRRAFSVEICRPTRRCVFGSASVPPTLPRAPTALPAATPGHICLQSSLLPPWPSRATLTVKLLPAGRAQAASLPGWPATGEASPERAPEAASGCHLASLRVASPCLPAAPARWASCGQAPLPTAAPEPPLDRDSAGAETTRETTRGGRAACSRTRSVLAACGGPAGLGTLALPSWARSR